MFIKTEKKVANSTDVTLITIRNAKDFEVVFTDVGAAIYTIAYPDKTGTMGKVSEGCKDLGEFIKSSNCFGKTVCPVAGRIKDAEAVVDGKKFTFEKNNGVNVLHSGSANQAFKTWDYEIKSNALKTDLIFTAKGVDGEGGFPGNIDYKVIYTIYEAKKELTIKFQAKTDRPALINMTNHIYLNLNGGFDKVLNHQLWLRDCKVAEMDQGLIIQKFVDAPTYLDYSEPKQLRDNVLNPILVNHPCRGMDHPFKFNVIDKSKPCATLYDPLTKRKMTMYTSYPAVVVYTDNYPDKLENQSGVVDDGYYGITFESVIPTNVFDDFTFTKDKPYSFVTKYKFN